MGPLTVWINANMDVVLFLYGLAFFYLGGVIFVRRRMESALALASTLWLLSAFGLTHGLNEFLEMWALIKRPEGRAFFWFQDAALAVSYVFLLEFGRRLLLAASADGVACCAGAARLLGRKLLAPALLLLAAAAGAAAGGAGAVPAFIRYLLGFPGAELAGLCLLSYRKPGGRGSRMMVSGYFALAGWAFLVYGFIGGLIVPAGSFFPASLLNADAFLRITGLPVQFFRALCAVAAVWGILGVMRVLNMETIAALKDARRRLQDIIDFLPDATFVVDGGRRVIAWNRALERLTGVRKEEMLGKGDYAYAVPFWGERRPILVDLITAGGGGEAHNYEYVQTTPDGALQAEAFVPLLYGGRGAHVWTTASALRDAEGNVYGAIESVRDVTDRRRAEERLAESEEKFKTLTEKSLAGVYLIQDGLFRYVNPRLAEIFGYAPEDLTDKAGPELLVAPEDWPLVRENLIKRVSGETDSVAYGFRGRRKGGGTIYVEVYGSRTVRAGKPAVIGTLVDVTQRRLAEDALQESENKFKTLAERSLVGIFLAQDGVMKYVNPKMLEILGRTREEVVGKMRAEDFLLPEEMPVVGSHISKLLSGEMAYDLREHRARDKDGRVKDIEVYVSATAYEGRPAIIGTMQDITGRKRMETALREEEERTRLILESAGDGIIGVNGRGEVLFANGAAQSALGWTLDEMKGRKLHPLIHHTRPDGSRYPVERCPMAAAYTDSAVGHVEDELLWRKDGSGFYASYSARPIVRAGRTQGAVITFRDVTARKKAEEEVRRLNAELEERVRKRTEELELARDRLVQSEKMSAVGQLAAGVAHEINNPLGIILGFAQGLVKRMKDGDPAAMPLRSIEREALRSKNLVQSLLVFSRSSRNEQRDEADLDEVIEGALPLVEARARAGGVEIALERSPVPLRGQVNRNQLQQIIVNLANNAVDAMPRGGKITVRTALSAEGRAVITVRDTGTGIPKEIRSRIFEPFFTTKEAGKGTGLGLSLVYEIVKKHGGSIDAESREGEGTVFTIALPLRASGKAAGFYDRGSGI